MVATEFTPVAALVGGALIGASAVALMAATGRIAGISGIASRLLPPWEEIPDDFRRGNLYTEIASAVFYGTKQLRAGDQVAPQRAQGRGGRGVRRRRSHPRIIGAGMKKPRW